MGISATIAEGLGALGVGEATTAILAPALTQAGTGAAIGAGTSALTGGDIGTGALTGGLSLGLSSAAGPALSSALGIGSSGGSALGGALGGAAGSAIGGGNPLTGAITGGIGGYLSAPSGSAATGASPNAGALPGGPASPNGAIGGLDQISGAGHGFSTGFDASSVAPAGTAPLGDYAGHGFTGFDQSTINPAAAIGGVGTGVGTGSPAATPQPGAGGTTPGTSVDKFLQNPSGDSFLDVLQANPMAALQGAGMLYSSTKGGLPPEAAALKKQAEMLASRGNELTSYLFSGQLPPGAKSSLDKATASAKAAIKSQFANLGISGSTMEVDALNQVDQNAASMMFNITNDMLRTGLQATGLSSQLYQALLGSETARDKDLQDSIANFALAAGGGYRLPTGQGGGTYYPGR